MSCTEECEKEKEIAPRVPNKEARQIRGQAKRATSNFAKTILKILGDYDTQQDRDYLLFLGSNNEERFNIGVEYALYEQSQACFAVNKLILKEGKIERITSYSDGERCSPDFADVEVKRDTYETLLVSGKIFFTWKEMKCIATLFFSGNYAEAHFIHNREDSEKMKKFQAKLRVFMKKHNYFKGEKLEFMPHSRLKFLKYPKMDWSALILKKELKDEIDLNLIFPIHNEKLCKKHFIPWRRGVLLAGVPGTGKTQLGRVLCNVLNGITVLWTTCKAVHDVSKVKDLFDIARNFSPTLIVLEDLDFFGHDREFITNPIVGELLSQLDGSSPNDGIFVLATTNRPHLLDKALADRPSRFDVKLLFEAPALKERVEMVKLFSYGKEMVVSYRDIAIVTDGLPGSHIKEVINYAGLHCLRDGRTALTKEDISRGLRKVKDKLKPSRKETMVS